MLDSESQAEPFEWDEFGFEMTFVENMRTLRERKGISQTDFAKRVSALGPKFHQPTVQRIERGERPLRLTEAVAIAKVLGSDLHRMTEDLSFPLAHELLVQVVDPDQFDGLVEQLERSMRSARFHAGQASEELQSYEEAARRFSQAPDKKLTDYAGRYVRNMREVERSLEAAVDEVRLFAKLMNGFERDFPAQLESPRHGEHPEA